MEIKKSYNLKIYAYLGGWVSILGNTVLFVIKMWAGVVTGSISIIADAWHTLSDSVSSIIILIGIKISDKKANKKYPFGFGRADVIASLILGVLLSMIGFEFLVKGIKSLVNQEVVVFGRIALVVTIVSILAKEAMAQFSFWTARKTGKKSLKADGWHHRSDALSSLIILAGIFLSKYFPAIDGLLGIILAIIIFYTAFEVLKESIVSIFGTSPPPEMVEKLKKIANKQAGFDVKLHHVHTHTYGNHTEATYHIVLPPEMTICEAHKIHENIEKQVFIQLGLTSTIRYDPEKKPSAENKD